MVASTRSFSVFTTLFLSIASVAQAHGTDGRRANDNRRHAAAAASRLARDLAAATPTMPPFTGATPSAPPLSLISSGMPTETPLSLFTTFSPGATAPIPGATPLPSGMYCRPWHAGFISLGTRHPCRSGQVTTNHLKRSPFSFLSQVTINLADYPTPDVLPPTDSPELAGWIAAVKAANIPNNPLTRDGDCTSQPDPSAAGSCWWTCGGCIRDMDISSCPDKNTWGISYDDGPSEYTPKLINYLHATNITATFFVVSPFVTISCERIRF